MEVFALLRDQQKNVLNRKGNRANGKPFDCPIYIYIYVYIYIYQIDKETEIKLSYQVLRVFM